MNQKKTSTSLIFAFATVYIVWGTTYLAMRISPRIIFTIRFGCDSIFDRWCRNLPGFEALESS